MVTFIKALSPILSIVQSLIGVLSREVRSNVPIPDKL